MFVVVWYAISFSFCFFFSFLCTLNIMGNGNATYSINTHLSCMLTVAGECNAVYSTNVHLYAQLHR